MFHIHIQTQFLHRYTTIIVINDIYFIKIESIKIVYLAKKIFYVLYVKKIFILIKISIYL